MYEERTVARVRVVLPLPPPVDAGATHVDFWTSEPLDMGGKGALGTTPGQTKGEKARDDAFDETRNLPKVPLHPRSFTFSFSFILLLFLHQHLVYGDYDEGGLGFSLTLIV